MLCLFLNSLSFFPFWLQSLLPSLNISVHPMRPFPGPLFAKLDALSWGCSKAIFSSHLRTQWAKDVLTSTRSRIQMDQQTNVSKTSWNLYCCLDENFMSPEKGIKQYLTSRNIYVFLCFGRLLLNPFNGFLLTSSFSFAVGRSIRNNGW